MDNKTGVKIKLDKERTLIYDLNRFIELEREYGSIKKVFDVIDGIVADLSETGAYNNLLDFRKILTIGLKKEDPDITEELVGDHIIYTEIPGLIGDITTAIVGSLPEPKEVEEGEEEGKN